MSDTRPIGVFDSGVGGLTVLHQLHTRLPAERLIYLADLAHFPYGPRYQHEVRDYALAIIEHLVGLDTKLVVVACNTATAAALNLARERFDVPVVGVIAPGAQAAVEATHNRRVAVISTEGTRASQEYVHAIKEANPGVGVLGVAVPELVDIIEAGEASGPRAEAILAGVLDEITGWGADTLVLGCTHYPLLRPTIERVLDGRPMTVVDSAETTAGRVERILAANRLAASGDVAPAPQLLVTAEPRRFSDTAELLFGDALPQPTVVALWASADLSGAAR
ncbi:MAG: glutamate racemase [Candidatus Dormibacteraeota bacterium]|uniref:Glutamate racemase n=1 Tax=Candidatus Aeolococcus gillhamiae TaxID=3127015 RepID=A0A2W5ZLB6_9BACT|nr:glutamate racemase [Candidatus Dormibacteraeota bacterium]PZR83646.1 MAG: glutamate racemase [Candidatus Dormibacter sp. RRmetagenome_bin12]